jgi:hypothetical protein
MIRAKQLPAFLILMSAFLLKRLLKWKFRKLNIHPISVKPGHSVLLLCNHFSFWDGFFAGYLAFYGLHKASPMKALYIMSVEKQLQLNPWMRWFGSFSIAPGKRRMMQSLDYAAGLLSVPGNILLYFPQGNLESCHVRDIIFQDGINHIIRGIKGNCQLIWSSNIIEYFESTKPSVDFNLLDCGTNKEYDFEKLKRSVNTFHRAAIDRQIRLTGKEQ